jgi:hypothetical protein
MVEAILQLRCVEQREGGCIDRVVLLVEKLSKAAKLDSFAWLGDARELKRELGRVWGEKF